jgi:hypothetical protein
MVRNQGDGVQPEPRADPTGSVDLCVHSAGRAPKDQRPDGNSKTLDPKPWIQNPGSKTLDPKPWIQNPGSKTLANHNKHHQTNDDGTTWALAILRRGYFPQPGVVAHATTPGGRPHRAPILKGLLSTPHVTFADSLLILTSRRKEPLSRFRSGGDRVPRVAAGGTTRG